MKHKFIKYLGIFTLLFLPIYSFGQQPMSPEEEEKQMREAIDKQVENMANLLDLEDWQIFYVDSIMFHDYTALSNEYKVLSASRVTNMDAYTRAQDKWQEQMYQSYQKIFNEAQWAKYLKSGASRDKKARDKREAKRNK